MESLLGHDLRDVRIHETKQAGELAKKMDAEAFAIGRHIFFAEDKLYPPSGYRAGLLAHELTHVIQQTRPDRKYSSPDRPDLVPGRSSGLNSTLRPPQLASQGPSGNGSNDVSGEAENAAQRVESGVRRSVNKARNKGEAAEIDVQALADRVYGLMQNELLVERDRTGR